MSISLRDGFFGESLDRVLEDLLVRFVINCPDEDLSSIERVFFQIEEAQWFYADFIRQINTALPSLKMKGFSTLMIERCPMIWRWGSASELLARFGKYKSTIPVRGAALLNADLDKMLLVKGTESNSWGFPRGKISKDEEDVLCAIREVKEETGYDCSDLIDATNYLERTIKGKNFKIFFIDGVPEDYHFEPVARNEIAEIAWKDIKSLNKSAKTNPNQYFLVSAMMKPITRYILMKKGKGNQEEVKRRVANELKLLLGVTNSTETLPDIDRGRDLLDKLKAAIKEKTIVASDEPNNNLLLVQQLASNMLPQFAPPPVPFEPFLPFFAHNGLPMPFSPNMIPLGQPIPLHFYPPPPGVHMPFPQQHQQQRFHQQPPHPGPSSYPQFATAPTPESLHKPSFSLANKRSKEADSKLLLGILNKNTPTEISSPVVELPQPDPEQEEHAFGDKKLVDQSKSNFLMNLFNKNSVISSAPTMPVRKVSILKREPEPAIEQKKISILKRSPELKTDGKNELLSLLKKESTSSPPVDTQVFSNGENAQRNPGKDLMAMLAKSESHSRAATPSNIIISSPEQDLNSLNSTKEGDKNVSSSSDGGFESYEDFEDFEDLDEPAAHDDAVHNNLLEYDDSEDEYEVESLQKATLASSVKGIDDNLQPNTANFENGTKKKIQILKRGEEAPEAINNLQSTNTESSDPLLLLLKKSNTTSSASGDDSSKLLLGLLKNRSSNSSNNQTSPAPQEGKSLLNLVQKNISPEPPVVSSPASTSASRDLLKLLNSGNSTTVVTPRQVSNDHSASSSLLSLLKRPHSQVSILQNGAISDDPVVLQPAPPQPSQPQPSFGSQLESNFFQGLLNGVGTSNGQQQQKASPNGGKELLNILHQGKNV